MPIQTAAEPFTVAWKERAAQAPHCPVQPQSSSSGSTKQEPAAARQFIPTALLQMRTGDILRNKNKIKTK